MKIKYSILLFVLLFASSKLCSQTEQLQSKIEQIIKTKNAKVGFAMSGIEEPDSLIWFGQEHFPMQSVYKFHLALAVLDLVDKGKLKLDQEIFVSKADLLPETWSPLREKYPNGDVNIKLSELLSYTVSQSDNNGCDILFKLIGGTGEANAFVHKIGVQDISIVATEAEMAKNSDIQFKNWTTPVAAIEILKIFYQNQVLSENSTKYLFKILVETTTGANRLKGKLPLGTEVAHKTGTSGADENEITAAFNDIGIVKLPNGKHFAIAVFITGSKENNETNAAIIADISTAVWDYFLDKSGK